LANVEAIRFLLSAGVKINVKNSPSHDILINYLNADLFAVRYPKTDEEKAARMVVYDNGIEVLLKAGANRNAKDEGEKSPLMLATEKGYLQIVKILLKSGLPANEQNQKDRALLIAAQRGHFEIAEVLTKNNANPNVPIITTNSDYGNDCNAPLTVAAERNDFKMAKLLIDNGADVNFICKSGTSAFTKAIERYAHNYYNPEYQKETEKIISLLFESGLDINATDERGTSPLMTAVYYNNYEVVEKLLKMKAPVDVRNKTGSTALMLSASSLSDRTFDVISLLIKFGANVNAANDSNVVGWEGRNYAVCETPLIQAAINASNADEPNALTRAMQLLVESGANVNFRCSSGESALTQAARSTSANGIKKLIELGADVKGEQGVWALKFAKERLKNDPGQLTEYVVAILEKELKSAAANPK
jgi:ankyrin repeat protein